MRSRLARRKWEVLKLKRDTQKAVALALNPYEPSLAELRLAHGPSEALSAISQRISHFIVSKMQACGVCLWCGVAWDGQHVDSAHYRKREAFMEHYLPFCLHQCAPLLIQIETLLTGQPFSASPAAVHCSQTSQPSSTVVVMPFAAMNYCRQLLTVTVNLPP